MKTLHSLKTNLKLPPNLFWPQISHTLPNPANLNFRCTQEFDGAHHGCAGLFFATNDRIAFCECRETRCSTTLHYYVVPTEDIILICATCEEGNHPRNMPSQQ